MLDFVAHTLHKRATIPLGTATLSLEERVARSAVKFVADLAGVYHRTVLTLQAGLQWDLQVRLDCLSLAIRLCTHQDTSPSTPLSFFHTLSSLEYSNLLVKFIQDY